MQPSTASLPNCASRRVAPVYSICLGHVSDHDHVEADYQYLCRTTTDLTTALAQGVARFLHLGSVENAIEYIVRAVSSPVDLGSGPATMWLRPATCVAYWAEPFLKTEY